MSIKIVVPISGGKDSQACLKLAVKHEDPSNVRALFCDTQFEHPQTYEHIHWMVKHYGVGLDIVTGGTVLEKSIKYNRFPGGGSRHCTDELKIRETRLYLKKLSQEQGGFEVWYGMRSDESPERNKRYSGKISEDLYHPHEIMPSKYPKYLGKAGVRFKLPILDWSREDVFLFLENEEHPHYADGFDRVGCFPCLASGDKWKEKAFNYDDFGREQYIKVQDIGKQIGKSIWTSKGGKFRNEQQGCLICNI